MKQWAKKASSALLALSLSGCITHTHDFIQSRVNQNLLEEKWQTEINTNVIKWKKNADNWLWFGTPNNLEQKNRLAPYTEAISTMMVKVPDFTEIKCNGDFQVQIDGRFSHTSVYLLGPNEEIRQVAVQVKDHLLDIHQLTNFQTSAPHVIVRIAMPNLQQIIQMGKGKIQGRFIRANPLTVTSFGSGDIILAGKINVRKINHHGTGDITLLGAYTPTLKIDSSGAGSINLSGRVGVEAINHAGSSDINILGADSNTLSIWNFGSGKIGIKGVVDLKQVNAGGTTSLYIYWIKANNLYLYVRDKAKIGLSGKAKNLYVDAKGASQFAGRYLDSNYTYVRARDWAHVNINAQERAFTAASNNSSIYVVGRPEVISPYVNDNAVVIPVEPPPRTATQWLEYRNKTTTKLGGETYLP